MFGLEKLFMGLAQKDRAMSKDRIARMLKDHPEALEATSTSRSRKPSKALSAA